MSGELVERLTSFYETHPRSNPSRTEFFQLAAALTAEIERATENGRLAREQWDRAEAAQERVAALKEALEACPLCGHLWRRHDPEDGCCDQHSDERIGVCQCGRDAAWMQEKIARLSNRALSTQPAEEDSA